MMEGNQLPIRPEAHAWWDFQDTVNLLVLRTLNALPVDMSAFFDFPGEERAWTELRGLPMIRDTFFSYALFFLTACVLLAGAWVLAFTFCNLVWPQFRAVQPAHKKWYVIANLSKALILGGQACSLAWWYYSYLHYRCTTRSLSDILPVDDLGPCDFDAYTYQETWSKTVSATYVITDFLALFIVPKLPMSTVIHHVFTTIFVTLLFALPLSDYQVGQKLLMYGFWSTLSFPVNAFLALRVVHPDSRLLKYFARFSAALYATCCLFNWSIHALWPIDGLYLQPSWGLVDGIVNLIYLILIAGLVQDDLKLLQWLVAFEPSASTPKRDSTLIRDKKRA